MSRLARSATLAALILFTSVSAAATDPRADAAGIARAIEDNYYDVARGRTIAEGLRADAAAGRFDALRDPRDLATALTDRLKPLDRHFVVRLAPAAPPAGQHARMPGPRPPPADMDRHGNYGVRRVEVKPGNLGYIDLRMFGDFEFDAPDQPARRAIESALQLVSGTDAMIIDLRDNGGGSPAMVGYLASAFTPRDADIYNIFHSREGTLGEAPRDWYPAPRLDVPLYLLVSARTASAAESFAYTLKNAKRAVIIGESTAGAANPGGPVDAGNGFTVFVSSGSPVSPITGHNWEGEGVQPDVAVAPADALRVASTLALEAVLKHAPPDDASTTDTRWALENLRAQSAPPATGPLDPYLGTYGSVAITRRDDRLLLRLDRRPALSLLWLGDDVFAVQDESSPRVQFERDAQGRVTALDMLWPDGRSSRYRRDG
jgi:hypothetical protein